MVITMTMLLHAFRSLAEPHSSMSVQFVTALMSSSQRARGLPLFLVPPPIPNIIPTATSAQFEYIIISSVSSYYFLMTLYFCLHVANIRIHLFFLLPSNIIMYKLGNFSSRKCRKERSFIKTILACHDAHFSFL